MSSHVYKALFAAQEEIQGVKKSSRNEYAKFDYVSAEDIIGAVKPVLNKHGLIFFPKSQVCENGVFRQVYSLVHVQSGEEVEISRSFVFVDEKGKAAAQAQGSAETYMLKNVLRELVLMVRYAKSEDIDSRDWRNRTPGNPSVSKGARF